MTKCKVSSLIGCALLSVAVAGCNSLSELENHTTVIIDVAQQEGIGGTGISNQSDTGQEGIGGSGLDPDGIGGTGIIGVVSLDEQLSVGGIGLASLEGVTVYYNGDIATAAAIQSGQIAAVRLDTSQLVTEIHSFDQELGHVPFLFSISELFVRGEVSRETAGNELNISGFSIPVEAAPDVVPGQTIQIMASQVAPGSFQVNHVSVPAVGQISDVLVTAPTNPSSTSSINNIPDKPVVLENPVRPEPPEPVQLPIPPPPIVLPKPPTLISPPAMANPVTIDLPIRPVRPMDQATTPVTIEPVPAPVTPPDLSPKNSAPVGDVVRPSDATIPMVPQ